MDLELVDFGGSLVFKLKDGDLITFEQWQRLKTLVDQTYADAGKIIQRHNEFVHAFKLDTTKPGFVYVVKALDGKYEGVYKIGQTVDIPRRMSDFGLQLPFRTELVFAIPAANRFRAEKALHTQFHHCRMNGEWFQLEPWHLSWLRLKCSEVDIEPHEVADEVAIACVS